MSTIIDELRTQGRLGEALAAVLGREVQANQTTAISCLNPEGHKHGDVNPSLILKPDVGRADCAVCGGAWGLVDLGTLTGYGADRAAVAARLEAEILGNGALPPASSAKPPLSTKEMGEKLARYCENLDRDPEARAAIAAAFRIPEELVTEFRLGWKFGQDGAPGRVVFPALSGEGQVLSMQCRLLDAGPGEKKSKTHYRCTKSILGRHLIDAAPRSWPIFWCTGEKDWIRAFGAFRRTKGNEIEAVFASPSGGEGLLPEGQLDFAEDRDHVLFADCGKTGLRLARRDARKLARVRGRSIRIIPPPFQQEPPDGADLFDFLEAGGTAADLLCAVAGAPDLREELLEEPKEQDEGKAEERGVRLDDFCALMPEHKYIFVPSRDLWPASSVNSRIPPIPLVDDEGEQKKVKANVWLDKNRPVEMMTWAPGEKTIIEDRLISHGGWIERPGCATFNLYRPPCVEPGDARKALGWLDHVARVYPDDVAHVLQWLAHRVQCPEEKINHALVLGGLQGVGKDTILEPVRHAVGPWNFEEVSPAQLLGRFNAFVKSVILRVSEARDLGDVNRYAFYDHLKAYTAAPPDVLRVDEKNIREYAVLNVVGVVITSNHKTSGIYLPADDRRHFVAWSELTKDDFEPDYWNKLYRWYEAEGYRHVAAYLRTADLSGFDPKAPPPKTTAFWEIVDSSRAPEDSELADTIEALGSPPATTLSEIALKADPSFADWLHDRKNSRKIPHRLEAVGYVPVRNDGQKDGRWKVARRNCVIYANRDLSVRDRIAAAQRLVENAR